jgi:RNA polymerase sigma-70 factor (ECF subfamily)
MSGSEMPLASPTMAVEPCFESGQASSAVSSERAPEAGAPAQTFDAIYRVHAPYVWRNARRLGVMPSAVEDVMQEVFLVVHRHLPAFEERTSVRAWLSAILIRVVRAHRRRGARERGTSGVEPDLVADPRSPNPYESVERDEAVRELYAVLSSMKEERREVLVLSELEDLTAPEIAHALEVNVNTVYWRLRTARSEFEGLLFRRRAANARSHR